MPTSLWCILFSIFHTFSLCWVHWKAWMVSCQQRLCPSPICPTLLFIGFKVALLLAGCKRDHFCFFWLTTNKIFYIWTFSYLTFLSKTLTWSLSFSDKTIVQGRVHPHDGFTLSEVQIIPSNPHLTQPRLGSHPVCAASWDARDFLSAQTPFVFPLPVQPSWTTHFETVTQS